MMKLDAMSLLQCFSWTGTHRYCVSVKNFLCLSTPGKIFAPVCRNVSPCTYQLFIFPLLATKISNSRFEMRMFILITTSHYMRQSVWYLILASLTHFGHYAFSMVRPI